MVTVVVGRDGIDTALKKFKELCEKAGVFRDYKRHREFESPGEKRRRKKRKAIKRWRRKMLAEKTVGERKPSPKKH